MTNYELMLKVKSILENAGFTTKSTKYSNARDYEVNATATKDNKSWYETVNGNFGEYKQLYGYTIDFSRVYRSNATAENISVDIKIASWKMSCGHTIQKERVNIHMSDKSILKRVNKIIDAYNQLELERGEI